MEMCAQSQNSPGFEQRIYGAFGPDVEERLELCVFLEIHC